MYAKWIYDNCSLGTQVTIINNGTDPLGRPKSIYLGKNASYPNWDPTDPNVNNPWHKEGVKFLADYSSLHKTDFLPEAAAPARKMPAC